tara:strand:- start:409 stop:663 length:255 start_codon:yes stop_codon:yes gene_type:complete
LKIKIQDQNKDFYVFENGDGTKYTVHITSAEYGGLYAIINEDSLWRWHGEGDVKFLCGNNNKWTRIAVIQIMTFHDRHSIGSPV